MNDDVCTLHRGSTPLLVSLPHVGTVLTEPLRARLVERALGLEDTDWHLERLYGFVRALDASLLVARHSRYLIDLNRPPENAPMYPGVNNTELCPTRFFSGDALYRDGAAPDDAEVQLRLARYWRPYHDALVAEIERLHARHGHVVLFDGHSIKSELPWLFEGRFKGGWITRHYGAPAAGVHAVQLEMGLRCYMDEAPPFAWDDAKAAQVQPLLRRLVEAMLAWQP